MRLGVRLSKTLARPPCKSPNQKDSLPISLEALKKEAEFRSILKPPRAESFLERACCVHGGFALSYFLLARSVGFRRCVWRRFLLILSSVRVRVSCGCYVWRRFRIIRSLVRVRCWFWTLCLAVVSSCPIVRSRVGVGFGRSFSRRFRLILSP